MSQRASAIEAELRAAKERVDLAQVRTCLRTLVSVACSMLTVVDSFGSICQCICQTACLQMQQISYDVTAC